MEIKVVPQRAVINQGAAKTHPRGRTWASGESAARATSRPSRSMPTSTRSRRGIRPAAQPAPTVASAASASTQSKDSERQAPANKTTAHASESRHASRRTSRSRRDGDRSVKGTSTQMRLKTSVPFVPPKPNEFFNATSMRISRAVFAQ